MSDIFSTDTTQEVLLQASAENKALGKLPLAMAYVPYQRWETPYEPENALVRGTIFPRLDLPFLGRRI